MGIKYSINAKMYYKVGGVAGGGSFVELPIVQDVTLALDKAEVDVTTRLNAGWEAVGPGLKQANVEFQAIWDPANAAFATLLDSYLNDTVIGLRVLDAASGNGLQADMVVFGFTRNESLKEAMTASVKMKPTYSVTPPTWVTAS